MRNGILVGYSNTHNEKKPGVETHGFFLQPNLRTLQSGGQSRPTL
jgi:hypothetical protein